jgi:pilus assembly protein CpaD
MPSHFSAIAGRRAAALAARGLLMAGLTVAITGCNTTARDTTGSVPVDYRDRHPIAIKEKDRTLTLFVGAGRGGLTPMQRAEVLAFAQTWKREATGGVIIDRPVGSPNERAAHDTLKQVLSILASVGIPNHGIGIKPYHPGGEQAPTLRIRYPQMTATAGPCGLWPDDLGVTTDMKHFDNQPYYNLGCATQRNLASMIENPADLVQPRGETPAYSGKRSTGIEKWRKGESPATTYPDTNKGAISDLGK